MTPLFTAEALSQALGGVMTRPFHANGVSIDTRSLEHGDLFVALATETGDGHDHVATALSRGAAGALVHRQNGLPDDAPLLVVGDTLAGLTSLGAYARERFTGAVAAITGSVGKTTTKEMLRQILAQSGATQAAVASYNNHWGVPLTLARLPEKYDFAVIEIGMNHPGEIAPLARLASPDIAVITNVESAHIGHMGSLAAIAAEKASIAQGVLQGGHVVLPEDSPMYGALRHAVGDVPVLGFGQKQISDLSHDAEGSTLKAEIAGKVLSLRIGAPGRHMVMNALAALTAAAALGADIEKGAAALKDFTAIGGRGKRRGIMGGRAILLDESYNASAASMRAAFAVLRLTPGRRHIAVLGDMLELGEHSVAEHTALAAELCDAADQLYACGPWSRFLYEAVPAEKRGAYAEDSTALAPAVVQAVRDGDVILIKGSFGSRMQKIVAALDQAGGNA
jgi:UDP-N-acetylmuramoyl-tripeptide--D-alanyl-D-alanine ligase